MTDWIPLPELPPPSGEEIAALCSLYPPHSRIIWAEGNPAGPVMVVLDNPGAREDRQGNPFVCGTRQALQTAAREAGLQREDLYVSWVLKWRPLRAYDKEAVRAAWLPYLEREMLTGAAQVIVLMGNVAVQAVLGDPTLEVKALRGQVLRHAGRPVVCSYHPLAARRRPNLLPYLVEDLRLAARVACRDEDPAVAH